MVLSLAFTLVYGYIAAYNAKAERFMIPLLDVLQSIPVLSFLPGVMLAMVALFPSRQLGVELGAVLLIFTGQVWNMAFSFYASLKSIPREMREAAKIYGFSWWQRFTEVELPFAAIGLVWNSMMSVAGGWFALMACEMFVLGSRDFRLPGLGSYLQTAASAGDTRSILLGVFTMIAVIVLLDQFVWRPVIAWAEKFKVEQVESADVPHSWVLDLIQHSRSLAQLRQKALFPVRESLMSYFSHAAQSRTRQQKRVPPWKDLGARHSGHCRLGAHRIRSGSSCDPADWTQSLRGGRVGSRAGRHISSRDCGLVDWRCLDDPRRCEDWLSVRAWPAWRNHWLRLRHPSRRTLFFLLSC